MSEFYTAMNVITVSILGGYRTIGLIFVLYCVLLCVLVFVCVCVFSFFLSFLFVYALLGLLATYSLVTLSLGPLFM